MFSQLLKRMDAEACNVTEGEIKRRQLARGFCVNDLVIFFRFCSQRVLGAASLFEKSRSSRLVHWFPLAYGCRSALTLEPGQDTFDHLFSLWLPSAARIALLVIRRYVSETLQTCSMPKPKMTFLEEKGKLKK
jgi:hypothetical protein